MKFNYTVSQEHYKDLLCALFKRRDRTPFHLLVLFVLTIGQTIWAIYYCCTKPLSTKEIIFISGWSILMSIVALLPRILRRTRAKITFKNLLSSQQLMSDFWSPHTFSFRDGDAVVSFGEVTLSFPAISLIPDEIDGIFLLYAEGKIFEFIPAEYGELKDSIRAGLTEAIRSQAQTQAQEFTPPEDPDFKTHVQITADQFIKLQVRVYQQYFINNTFLRPMFLFKCAVTIYLVRYVLTHPFGLTSLLLLGCGTVLITPAFMCISPLTRHYLLSKVRELNSLPTGPINISYYIKGYQLTVVRTGMPPREYDLRKFQLIQSAPAGLLLFDGSWPAPAIPSQGFSSRTGQTDVSYSLRKKRDTK